MTTLVTTNYPVLVREIPVNLNDEGNGPYKTGV